eukprot:m.448354 g.448354  ORF g.448354 m.448354 type:complete len:367 (+) comp19648_c0_seq1:39-1139(+)
MMQTSLALFLGAAAAAVTTITAAPVSAAPPPVKVFILLGQSNMLGEGRKDGAKGLEGAVTTQGMYPYLWDAAKKNWSTSENVRSVFLMASGGPTSAITLFNNEFMTGAETTPSPLPGIHSVNKNSIGPELGIGFTLGNYTSDPVMCLKSCIGGRSLGWDLLPPTQTSFDYTDPTDGKVYTYAGYHQSPNKWLKGTTPKPISWEAGIQYDGDVFRASQVLANLSTYYPGATDYEVAGFFWWQGSKDAYDMALAQHYEENLVALIKSLRLAFKSPNAKFVAATLGQTLQNDTTSTEGVILHAQQAVDGTGQYGAIKYPEFKGNVATVYSHPYSQGSTSQNHYGGDPITYMNIGQAMGQAMVELLKSSA